MGANHSKLKNLIGQQFGKLTVLEFTGARNYKRYWKCLCECGNISEVITARLTNGHTKSCGCLSGEKHGKCKIPEYAVWCGIIKRCSNIKEKAYKNYGGRGIAICGRWLHSFENFYADMGARPSPEHTIERKDNDKGYSPDNCKWATTKEQNRNYRRNVMITHKGETLCMSDWANKIGISPDLLGYRIKRWTVEEALLTPVNSGFRVLRRARNEP
jgi:hypothetical protein